MPKVTTKKLRLMCSRTDHNPNMEDSWRADHWACKLRNVQTKKQMSFVYSKGSGHHGKKPSLNEVVESMKMDAGGLEYSDGFEDWASEYGYDPYDDKRKARQTYNAVKRQTTGFKRVLGRKVFDKLVK